MPLPTFPQTHLTNNPQSIFGADLEAYFRADAGITLDGSNNVSNWVDLTGNGHDLAQATPGNRPNYIATGGPLGRPYVASGTSAAAWMQHGGTPLTMNAGDYTIFIIASVQAASAPIKVYTTTLTTPAGCAAFALRKSATEKPDVTQLGLSAPTTIVSSGGTYTPATTWIASVVSMDSSGNRSFYTAGAGTSTLQTDAHVAPYGARLAEGYIFRFGASMYTNLAAYELGFVKRASTSSDANRMRAYARSLGLSV